MMIDLIAGFLKSAGRAQNVHSISSDEFEGQLCEQVR